MHPPRDLSALKMPLGCSYCMFTAKGFASSLFKCSLDKAFLPPCLNAKSKLYHTCSKEIYIPIPILLWLENWTASIHLSVRNKSYTAIVGSLFTPFLTVPKEMLVYTKSICKRSIYVPLKVSRSKEPQTTTYRNKDGQQMLREVMISRSFLMGLMN